MARNATPLLLAAALLAAACGGPADGASENAATNVANARPLPALTGRVVDMAELLPADREASLVRRLEALERSLGPQLVVVTVPDLGGEAIEDYGYRLGNGWGIGSAERDDGVLLIVAVADRRVRIEVGEGLEQVLTDPFCAQVLRRDVVPRFREADYVPGIEAGVRAIEARVRAMPLRAGRGRAA